MSDPNYCICADPENCVEAVPGYVCKAGHTVDKTVEGEDPGIQDADLRNKALRMAELLCQKAFDGKRSDNIERHMSRTELSAYLVIAFEFGSRWESRR